MLDFTRFLESPKSLFNLLSSAPVLKGDSGVTPVYLSFTLSFAGIGDTEAFSYAIPQGYQGFLWQLGYFATQDLRGNLAGQVSIDGKLIFGDSSHLRPQVEQVFVNFEPVEGSITGSWITTANVTGGLHILASGMLLRSEFYQKQIQPTFEALADDLLVRGVI